MYQGWKITLRQFGTKSSKYTTQPQEPKDWSQFLLLYKIMSKNKIEKGLHFYLSP